jgi:hypothetical protein
MFPHRNFHKFTVISRWKDNKIDHILIDKRRHSIVPDIRSFSGADCDADHYLLVANLGRDWQWLKKKAQILYGEFQCQEIKRGRG